MKTVKLKKSTPKKAWVTQELLRLIQKKNDLFILYLNLESQEVLSDFKKLRNETNRLRRSCVQKYYGIKFKNNKGNTKGTWTTINELLNVGKKNENPASLNVDDRIVVERKEISDVLGKHFRKYVNQ